MFIMFHLLLNINVCESEIIVLKLEQLSSVLIQFSKMIILLNYSWTFGHRDFQPLIRMNNYWSINEIIFIMELLKHMDYLLYQYNNCNCYNECDYIISD